jgi:hypothetical protein
VVLVSIATSLNHSLWVGAGAYALLPIVGPQLLKLERNSNAAPIPDRIPLTDG